MLNRGKGLRVEAMVVLWDLVHKELSQGIECHCVPPPPQYQDGILLLPLWALVLRNVCVFLLR